MIFRYILLICWESTGGRLEDMSLFYAWAGTVILAPRYQHVPQELTPARYWTNKWKTRAGCQDLKYEEDLK